MDEQVFSVQAEVAKIETRAHGAVRVTFDSQEDLSTETRARMMGWHDGNVGHLTFLKEKPITPEDALNLPPLTKDEKKRSKAQELRLKILFWGRKKEVKEEDSEAFYNQTMDGIIAQVDEKLN